MNGLGLNDIQWPAMAVTVIAGWLVASASERRRALGFWLFLLSNLLWIAWGWHAGAHALVALQVCLAFMNIRGTLKNKAQSDGGDKAVTTAKTPQAT